MKVFECEMRTFMSIFIKTKQKSRGTDPISTKRKLKKMNEGNKKKKTFRLKMYKGRPWKGTK